MELNIEKEREDFEAFVREKYSIGADHRLFCWNASDSDYAYEWTNLRWNVWEARAALSQPQAEPAGYIIYVEEKQDQYFVDDIEEAMDDLTNHGAVAYAVPCHKNVMQGKLNGA